MYALGSDSSPIDILVPYSIGKVANRNASTVVDCRRERHLALRWPHVPVEAAFRQQRRARRGCGPASATICRRSCGGSSRPACDGAPSSPASDGGAACRCPCSAMTRPTCRPGASWIGRRDTTAAAVATGGSTDDALAARRPRPAIGACVRMDPCDCGSSPSPSRAPATPRSAGSPRRGRPRLRRVLPLRPLPEDGRRCPASPARPTAWTTLAGARRRDQQDPARHAGHLGDLPATRAARHRRRAGRRDERRPGGARPRRRLVRGRARGVRHSVPAAEGALRPARGAARDHHRPVGDAAGRDVLLSTARTTRSPTRPRCPSRCSARARR